MKLVQGHGINDADYVTNKCPFYKRWSYMLQRVYSEKYHVKFPTYIGTTIDPDWLIFSNFKRWMEQQDWEGKELDKDLLDWTNKHYGPDNCLFVSRPINNLLTLSNKARGDLPLGVTYLKKKKHTYIIAQIMKYGKAVKLGYFDTVEEAHKAYKVAKLDYIKELAAAESDPRIKAALLAIF